MKHSKRKKRIAPAATSVALPAAEIASAGVSASQTVRTGNSVAAAPADADYVLSANSTIQEGGALKTALLNLEDATRTVKLDVHAVERVDTAALQLLCAFVRERRTRGRRTEWVGSAPTFSEAVEILGLTQALGYAAEKAA